MRRHLRNAPRVENNNVYSYIRFESNTFPFFAVIFYNISEIMSATEFESSTTLKENDYEMYKRNFDLKEFV